MTMARASLPLSIPRRHRGFHAASALVALAQLVLIAIAPFADRGIGHTTPAHVEPYGVSAHYAHDEATCQACVARQLSALVPRQAPPGRGRQRTPRIPPAPPTPLGALRRYSQSAPRAPPRAV
jgi:hypothetical protein